MREKPELQNAIGREDVVAPPKERIPSKLKGIARFVNVATLLVLAATAEGCACAPHRAYNSAVNSTVPVPEKKRYVRVSVHNIKTSDGKEGASDDQMNIHIASLSSAFKKLNIEFQRTETKEIRNDDLLFFKQFHGAKAIDEDAIDEYQERLKLFAEENATKGHVNIFFVDNIGINVAARAMTLDDDTQVVFVTYKGQYIDKYFETLPHEVGHLWGCYHPDAETFCKELVDGSNSGRCGDFLPTPADPGPWNPDNPEGCKYDEKTCTIISCGKDEAGQTYRPDITNMMSSYPGCRRTFSPEQIATMNYLLINTEIRSVIHDSPL